MNYTVEEVNHILYHNRSSDLIENFLPNFDIKYLIEKEDMLIYCRKLYNDNPQEIEFETDELNFDGNDIVFERKDIEGLSDYFKESNLSDIEYNYLKSRNVGEDLISKYNLSGISFIKDNRVLDIIGATTHPIAENILGDGVKGGGIVIPLYENDKLVNVAIRRIDSSNKLKYTLAVPDIYMWGLYDVPKGEEIWISEGLFDRISMLENGFKNVISASTPGLSIIHLLKIMEKKPSIVNIWSDKDQTGLKHSAIIQKFLRMNGIPCETYVSEEAKDADIHFNEYDLSIDDIYPIKITKEMIHSYPKNVNKNFIEYLKTREY